MSGVIKLLVLSGTVVMSNMSSVERIYEYTNCKDHEKPWTTAYDKEVSPKWPEKGNIEVKNLEIRYRKNLPLVLKGISFKVKSGEKVGIVGRTGSGKSTTLLALMRILEIDQNSGTNSYIKINGVKIGNLGLHKLRSKLTIIPQDPFLLEGTLRSNIDPLEEKTDEEILEILTQVEFFKTVNKDQISNQNFISDIESENLIENRHKILDLKVEQKGSNFSLGQRQLICIAKSLIRNPKILLMDEATANIDQRTDEIIQKVLKSKMDNTTVITIAHRLNTVIQYDKIITLFNGRISDIGHPYDLIQMKGDFWKMIEEGGREFKEKMVRMARENKRRSNERCQEMEILIGSGKS